MKHLLLVLISLLVAAASCFAQQETIRVATYSLLRFDSDDEARVAAFQSVVNGVTPDILICQDIISEDGADFFLNEVLDAEVFDRAVYIDREGQNDNMCFFRSDLFTCGNPVAIETDLRDVTVYPLSRINEPFLPVLYVATTYLKGSSGGANEQRRLGEVNEFLNYIDAEGLNAENILFGGVFNLYDSDEPVWAALHENELFKDPIETPGDWHDGEEFVAVHTQSTRTDQFGGGAPGGLDDRFDFIFITSTFDDEEGWMYVADSYTAYGNDGNHLNQAITEGENQAVPEEVAQALHDASDHLPVYMDISYVPTEIGEFTIRLHAGWNMISSPIQPIPADMESVWADVVDRNNLRLTKNDQGQFYAPGPGFNNMGDWVVTRAFQAKMTDVDELVVSGQFAPEDTPIDLREGWTLVPYLPEQRVAAPDAVAGIVDELILIKDFYGRFYRPDFGFSNMGALRRSQGYYVKMNAEAVLVWNVPEDGIRNVEDLTYSIPTHLLAPMPTGNNMSILITADKAGLLFGIGSEIGAFTPDGKCVGSAILNDDSPSGMAVWGDDPTTSIIEGAMEGETISFKVRDSATCLVFDPELDNPSIKYTTDGFELLTISGRTVPNKFMLDSPYPNPFNSSTNISFSIPEQQQTSLSILDISGRETISLIKQQLLAGSYQFSFKADDLPSGVYLVRLKAGQLTKTAKITLLK